MQAKMAVIGEYDSVLAFKAGGVDVFGASSSQEAKEIIRKIAKKYAVIFLTDDYAIELDDFLKRFLEEAYPIITTIPSSKGDNGYAMNKLKEEMDRALGVDILFRDKERDKQ